MICDTIWLHPYEFDIVFDNGTMSLVTIDNATPPLLANGHCLQLYDEPASKDSFVNIVLEFDIQIMGAGESYHALPNF